MTSGNMEFLKIPAPSKVPKKNGLKEIKLRRSDCFMENEIYKCCTCHAMYEDEIHICEICLGVDIEMMDKNELL